MKTFKLIPALIVMTALLFGCGKDTPEPEPEPDPAILPEKIVFYHGDTTMAIGSVDFMLARVSPRNATDQSLEWSSSDASVVSVDEKGGFKAEKEGTATNTVKARAGVASAQRKMTVESDIERVRGYFTYESGDRMVLNIENKTNTIVTPSDIEYTMNRNYSPTASMDSQNFRSRPNRPCSTSMNTEQKIAGFLD